MKYTLLDKQVLEDHLEAISELGETIKDIYVGVFGQGVKFIQTKHICNE